MLDFLSASWLGLHIYTWIILALPFLMCIYVWISLNREWIIKQYYVFRWPEKVIRVIIHYEGGMYKVFWRLIPTDDSFKINDAVYKYSDSRIIKPVDMFGQVRKDKTIITIDDREYDFDKKYEIKGKKEIYPEIHYFFNDPDPVGFKKSLEKDSMTSTQLKDFEENLLWSKLLNIESEKLLIIFCLFLIIINIIFSILIFCVQNKWINFAKNVTTGAP